MDFSGCSSQPKSRTGKTSHAPRRYWTPLEEQALITALLALRATGWKCDGSFKGGYMVRLESMLADKLPKAGIRVTHIKSKLQVWKKAYAHVCGILGSSGGAGASLDSITNMIVCESESVWDEYIKVHSDAAKLQGRPLPWFNSWTEIFGNDRSHGAGAVDVGDAVNEMMYGNCNNTNDKFSDNISAAAAFTPLDNATDDACDDAISHSVPMTPTTQPNITSSSGKRKRSDSSMDVLQGMMGRWMDDTNSALGNLASTLKPETTSNQIDHENFISGRTKLYESVAEIDGLSLHERVRATHLLAHSEADREAFWGMPQEAREVFVRMLLTGHI